MIALLGLVAAQDAPIEEPPSRVPVALVDRPLTTPEDTFELVFVLGGSQLEPRAPVVFAESGARYGITSDLEVGTRLLRVSFSPARNTGLDNPTAYVRYRVLSGVLELGGQVESEIPFGGVYTAAARIDLLLRIAPVARIDLRPEVVMFAETRYRFAGLAPLEIGFQIGDHVRLAALGVLEMRDLEVGRDLLGRVGLRASYTFGGEGSATADLGILLTTPNLALVGERPNDPAFNNYFLGVVDLSWFIANTSPDPWRGIE